MTTKSAASPTKVTLGLVLSWIFGVFFTVAGVFGTIGGGFGFAVPVLLAGILLLPPVKSLIRERLNVELSTGLTVAIVAVLLIISIVNTPNDDGVVPSPSGTSESAALPAVRVCETGETVRADQACPAVVQMGDRVQAGDFAWTFTGSRQQAFVGNAYFDQKADGVYLIVSVEAENTGSRAQYLSADMVKLIDDRGREFVPDTSASIYLGDDAFTFDRLNPGIVKRGVIVYDIPKDLTVARVRLSSTSLGSDSYYVKITT